MARISMFFISFLLLISCSTSVEKLIGYIDEGDIRKVKAFIDEGFVLNNDEYPIQPLEYAIQKKRFDIAELLIKSGADATLDNFNLLEKAISNSDIELLSILIQSDGIKASTVIPSTGYTVFYWVSQKKVPNVLKVLGKQIWDYKETVDNENILFNIYKNYGLDGLVSIKIDNDEAFNQKNRNGVSLLGLSLIKGDFECVKYLLEEGTSIDSISNDGPWFLIGNYWNTGYDDFFSVGSTPISLLDSTADIYSGVIFNKNLDQNQKLEKIEYFKRIGIETETPDKYDMTPLDYAYELGYEPSISIPSDDEKKEQEELRKFGEKVIHILSK